MTSNTAYKIFLLTLGTFLCHKNAYNVVLSIKSILLHTVAPSYYPVKISWEYLEQFSRGIFCKLKLGCGKGYNRENREKRSVELLKQHSTVLYHYIPMKQISQVNLFVRYMCTNWGKSVFIMFRYFKVNFYLCNCHLGGCENRCQLWKTTCGTYSLI